MVSFDQTHLLFDPNNIQSKTLILESEISSSYNSSKKRKWEEESPYVDHHQQQISFDIDQRSKADRRKSNIFHNIDLQLESNTPLPLEWQRCLDIQVHIK